MKPLALILGAAGQLGEAMVTGLAPDYEIVGLTRAALDISSAEDVRATVTSLHPDVIVNCAAYTNVDGAETAPLDALAINAWAVRTLARLAKDIDARLVHYGTDFVFDGVMEQPYVETDMPNPRGAYAASKLLGEWFAAECPRHYVLRVESLFGGSHPHSTVDKMLARIRAGEEVRAFSDRTVSPSFVDDVVRATARLIELDAPAGLYHCVNSGWTTWVGVARELARLTDCPDAPIASVAMADAKLLAPRPQFAALSNDKLRRAGVEMPTWQDSLRRYIHDDRRLA